MKMKYSQAIHDAIVQVMRHDERVFICGLGVPDPKGVFGTTLGLLEEFGPKRVFDTPACENATVGMLIGAAQQGLRPIMVNQRVDFTLLALDQIINHAAKWRIMFGDIQKVPLVIRMIVGKGWGQGPQHSQSMHALFAHIPGLKVVAPASPRDIKGLLISAVEGDDPVILIEHRRIYDEEGDVPEGLYRIPLGEANIVYEGKDVTIVATSQMVSEAKKAREILAKSGVSVELVDLRTLRPLDTKTVINSVKKTGRLVAVDGDWGPCGIAGEIVSIAAENCFNELKSPPRRITWPDMPAPTSVSLESEFYPNVEDICSAVYQCLDRPVGMLQMENAQPESFIGPF